MANIVIPKKRLNDGREIPMFGLGVFRAADGDEAYNAVRWALDAGYRHIDTAAIYNNEESVGKAIRDSGIPREEIFLTTKLFIHDARAGKYFEAFEDSMKKLNMDYIDLYLIHWPETNTIIPTWEAFIKIKETGRSKSIGVCNSQSHHLQQIFDAGLEKPVVNQCSCNPTFQQEELVNFCKENDVAFQSWSPLGGFKDLVLDNETLCRIAEKYGKTAAQVVIRWHLQRDLIVFPKSSKKERIIENINVFDFELSDEDMLTIKGLETGVRVGPDPDNLKY